ncbi:tetratricopeptide repeat protein [Maribacter sp. 2307UL18-2]|uniref:tetratricopeptide repeat-containing sensor histidine kinase n=1 Tax=Maribacter sp. 2307UL18-2 TaxID=3386274 RepID=UPI0039BD90FE
MKIVLTALLFYITPFSGFSQNDSITIKNLLDLGYEYEQNNPDSAIITYNNAYELAKKAKLDFFAGKSNQYKGIVYSDMGKYDSAIYYYEKSKFYFIKNKNLKVVADVNVNIGNVHSLKADYTKTVTYYLKALHIYDSIKEPSSTLVAYGNLATIFEKIHRFEEAKNYYYKSIEIAKKLSDSTQLVYNYYNLSSLFLREKKKDSIISVLTKAKQYLSKNANPHLSFLIEYGESQYFLESKNYPKALELAQKALEIEKKINDPNYMAMCHILIAKCQLFLNRLDSAEQNARRAIDFGINNKDVLMNAYSLLSDIFKSKKSYKAALHNTEIYFKYYDSLINEGQRNTINSLNIQYETERKDKEIAEQKLAIEKKQVELQKKQTQYSIMTGITIILLISSLMGWFLYQQRQKRKNQEILTLKREQQVKTLESLMEGEEKERFRIAKELHDGVNGDLSAIKYKLTSMLEHNTAVVNEVVTMIDKSSEQVRAISHNLVPPSLERFNLVEALEDYCGTMNEVHEPKIDFQHIGEHPQLSKNNEINIYRIVQELVSNSIKHAKAKQITVQISCHENNLQITVEDNGKGFDPTTSENKGIGLKNIASRIEYLKAAQDLVSNKKGTSFTIEVDTTKLNDN